ncbi:MAG: hypothetical protein KF734_09040 [Saprospiraceae bacterium]|nr:hypothetical protein [Saprospiraceae bacterium]
MELKLEHSFVRPARMFFHNSPNRKSSTTQEFDNGETHAFIGDNRVVHAVSSKTISFLIFSAAKAEQAQICSSFKCGYSQRKSAPSALLSRASP